MYNEEIYVIAKEIYGGSSDQLKTVCGAVESMLKGRLKPGYTIEDCRDAFITAAAVIAVETYSGMQSPSSGVASYTAGNVTVRRYASASGGKMTKYAESLLAPYLIDDSFAFTGV